MIYPNKVPNLLLVSGLIFLKETKSFSLGWTVGVRIVQQILDAHEDLLDCDGGLPRFLLVQDAQADGARRVHVGVEEWWRELACTSASVQAEDLRGAKGHVHLGGLVGYSTRCPKRQNTFKQRLLFATYLREKSCRA